MSLLSNYINCAYCNKKLTKIIKNRTNLNFYEKIILKDYDLKKEFFKKIKSYECQKCFMIKNNPWFNKDVSANIYSNIYGQHHRSWQNLIDFINTDYFKNHKNLYELISKKFKIKNYAEFNSPFMGLFLDIFDEENSLKVSLKKNLSKNIVTYLSSRQVAGKNDKIKKLWMANSNKALKKIKILKKKINYNINKFLVLDHSDIAWGINDNYKSVNSISYAKELLNLKTININELKNNFKFDLFGLFLTLDHTHNPRKILNMALQNSKLVMVKCHINRNINKQHLFSLSEKFLNYLKKQRIFVQIINDRIEDKKLTNTHHLYFICSKKNFLI